MCAGRRSGFIDKLEMRAVMSCLVLGGGGAAGGGQAAESSGEDAFTGVVCFVSV